MFPEVLTAGHAATQMEPSENEIRDRHKEVDETILDMSIHVM
jgi:hypothetical protein